MKRLLLVTLLSGCGGAPDRVEHSPTTEQAKAACGGAGLQSYSIEQNGSGASITFQCHPDTSVVLSEKKTHLPKVVF